MMTIVINSLIARKKLTSYVIINYTCHNKAIINYTCFGSRDKYLIFDTAEQSRSVSDV